MPIFAWIILAITLVLCAFLLLPVKFIIRNDDENHIYFRVKFLFWTFGEPKKKVKQQPQSKSTGIEQLKSESLKARIQRDGLIDTVTVGAKILTELFRELVHLFRHCVAEKFEFKLLCSSDDAAETAIKYGSCCAIVYPLLGFINSAIKVNPKGRKIDISCQYNGVSEVFRYDFLISVRVLFIVAALLRFLLSKAFRAFFTNRDKEKV